MRVDENGDTFTCSCGFSWERGRNGAHNCEPGLYRQIGELQQKLDVVTALAAERRQFILNGVEMGYIRLPDESTKDPATDTYNRCLLKEDFAGSAILNPVRAEGIEMWIESRNGAWNGTTEQAKQFAAQLRTAGQADKDGE